MKVSATLNGVTMSVDKVDPIAEDEVRKWLEDTLRVVVPVAERKLVEVILGIVLKDDVAA